MASITKRKNGIGYQGVLTIPGQEKRVQKWFYAKTKKDVAFLISEYGKNNDIAEYYFVENLTNPAKMKYIKIDKLNHETKELVQKYRPDLLDKTFTKDITFKELVAEWSNYKSKTNLEENSLHTYLVRIKSNLSCLYDTKIQNINEDVLEREYIRICEKFGFKRVLRVHKGIITSIFHYAYKKKYYKEYFIDKIDFKNIEKFDKTALKKIIDKENIYDEEYIPTSADIVKVINYSMQSELYKEVAIIAIMGAFFGLRQSEIMGIQLHDIDFKNSMLSIYKQVKRINGKLQFKYKMKTKDSARINAIPPEAQKYIKLYIDKVLKENMIFYGSDYRHDLALLVCKADGDFIAHSVVDDHWRKCLSSIPDLKYFSMHKLRHYHTSYVTKIQMPEKLMQQRLGHSNVKMTHHYMHVSPKDELKYINDMSLNS